MTKIQSSSNSTSKTKNRISAWLTVLCAVASMAQPVLATGVEAQFSTSGSDPYPAPSMDIVNPIMSKFVQSLVYNLVIPAQNRIAATPNTCSNCTPAGQQEPNDAHMCASFYDRLMSKRVLHIQASFGYMDSSEGEPYLYDGHDFGFNSPLDSGFYGSFRTALKARCHGQLEACGFSEPQPGLFVKDIRGPHGSVQVEIRSGNPSLTPYAGINTHTMVQAQQSRSANSREAYLEGVSTADVVMFIGHSRNGGGPDFYPPVLLSNRQPNYKGYYQLKHPGVADFLNAVHARTDGGPAVVGFYSCLSEHWFASMLNKNLPQTGYVLSASDGLSDMDDNTNGAIATIDSLLRQQCFSGFQQELDRSSKTIRRYNIRNFLTNKSPLHFNDPVNYKSLD